MHIGGETSHRFWMVYGERQSSPTYKHDSRDAAETEALRLAELNPGGAFYVLKGVRKVKAEKPATLVTKLGARPPVDDDGIPF